MGQRAGRSAEKRAAEERLFDWFADLVMADSDDNIMSFCRHAGIFMPMDGDANAWWATFLSYYLRRDGVDEARFADDLATWEPIARRIAFLKKEREAKLKRQANQKRRASHG